MKTLYKVTCCSMHNETKNCYVVAENPKEAEEKALKTMSRKKYKYDNHVSNIEIIAKEDGVTIPILII